MIIDLPLIHNFAEATPSSGFPTADPGWMVVPFFWDAVGGAESYQLEIGTSSGGTEYGTGNVGLVLTYSLGLPPGTYYSRVRAVIGGVAGTASTEDSFFV